MYVVQDKDQRKALLNLANSTSSTQNARIFFTASDSAINIHPLCFSEELRSIIMVVS